MPTPPSESIAIDVAAANALFLDAHTAYAFTDESVSDAELEEIY